MLAHYLAVALAKFRKTPIATAANVLTLALGLASFIAAYGIASYWRSADDYHPNADRLVFISQSINAAGAAAPRMMNQIASPTLARYLEADFPEIETVARALDVVDVALAAGERKTLAATSYVDPAFLDLFRFDFVEGDAGALADPNGMVLTQDAARRLFGDAPALGRTVVIDARRDATVTGVIAPVRQPSFMGEGGFTLRFEALRPWLASPDGAGLDATDNWLTMSGFTIARLAPTASIDELRAGLPAFIERRMPSEQRTAAAVFLDAYPIGRMWMLGLQNVLFPGAGLSVIAVLFALGAMTLAVACLNYANLATAQAAGRAKEFGLRKVLGAGRWSVMAQAWLEAGAQTAIALVLALAVLALAAPAISTAINVDILYFLSHGGPMAYGVIAGLVAASAFAAGALPALHFSRARAGDALRMGRSRTGSRLIARLLVTVQFAAASFLLIMLTVTELQRDESERVARGGREDPVVVLNALGPLGVRFDTLEARLRALPGVVSVTVTSVPPWSYSQSITGFARTIDPEATAPVGLFKNVGYDYFATLGFEILAGRVFDRDRDVTNTDFFARGTEPPSIVIDRAYAERLGYATPADAVDEIVFIPARYVGAAIPARIVGVTETEVSGIATSEVEGHVYAFAPTAPTSDQHPLVRLTGENDAATLEAIARVWDELAPAVPLDVVFLDELFAQRFFFHARIGQLFLLLTATAFVISTTGLLGMAVHAVSRRRHEVAVRKVLGSSALGVVRLLLVDFSKPILAGNLIAWPLGYFAAQTYLSFFAHRIELTPGPFVLSMAITLAIAWVAVLGEVLKAASVRPAEVLRHA
jgi:putative ABC transport system permease protein